MTVALLHTLKNSKVYNLARNKPPQIFSAKNLGNTFFLKYPEILNLEGFPLKSDNTIEVNDSVSI